MDNWIWGLSLIALTLAIHATGVAFMVSALHRLRLRLERRTLRFPHVFVIVITAITTLGLPYTRPRRRFGRRHIYGLTRLGRRKRRLLYSVDSMATRGASGVTLQPHWQMLGALEAADGMLLFGISTAFIFTVMQYYFRDLRLMGD
jgi:hypothetical protein